MDIANGMYGFFGTNDPAVFLLDVLVTVVFAVSIVYLALELWRVYAERSRKETPTPAIEPQAAYPHVTITQGTMATQSAITPPPMEIVKAPVHVAPKPAIQEAPKPVVQEAPKPAIQIPAIDVVKGSLSESMIMLTQKYRLASLTLASRDGLVIASTGKTPDQDAAIYSGLFEELFKVKHEPYYYIESKEVSLYSAESGAQKVIGVAYRKGAFAPEEIKAIRDDTKRVVDRFTTSGMAH